MCGFVALISKRSKKINPELIRRMNQEIFHRGPDDEGFYFNDWVGLGFRRLSIIDLSDRGHQPMFDESGRYVCVFNGEIYNYLELKKELENEGVTFSGGSDSEVLLNAFIQWGEDCLKKFIGMFAFLIVDLKMQSVFIARDFPGIKPLYFTEDDDYYYFASEIKAFSKVMPLSVNPDCYFEHFNFRYLAGDKTHFDRVCKVLPGNSWLLRFGKIDKKAYFNLSDTFSHSQSYLSMEEVVLKSRDALQDSFLLHTRSDVGYCLQLSGGVDSSYLTSILAETKKDIDTFSVQTQLDELDESPYQRQVIARYGTQHHAFLMTGEDYANLLERATYHLEAPIVHSGSVFLMELCRHIREKAKVVLTGEGADELFGGYWRHKPVIRDLIVFQLQKHGVQGRWMPSFSKLGTLKQLLQDNMVKSSHRYQLPNAYQQFFLTQAAPSAQRLSYARSVENDFLSAILAYDQQTYLASLLDRQDKLSMSYSVEARVPYCNQALYQTINPMSSRYKLYQGERKAILKRCAHDALPNNLIYRRKNGFKLPVADWYRDNKLVGRYLDYLIDNTARQRGIYQIDFLKKAVAAFRKGDDRYAKPLTMLVNLELFHRVYRL